MEGSKGEKRLGPEVRGELRWGDFETGLALGAPLVGGFRLSPVPLPTEHFSNELFTINRRFFVEN